ncbi:hypothetical protein SDC9_176193 [bioreactor metagenome]|uniref:Uncharacterized protein n=1 Tax=bioreactor metagenome TaxID=1076179 RepID=A0A645GPA5_9ZZZZ
MFNSLIDGKDRQVAGMCQTPMAEQSLQIIQSWNIPVRIDP